MKIEHLEIKNYKQFTDLTLDLTYPKGHEKEGQPLDKICIIGQSGTGKTNLLEVIQNRLNDNSVITKFQEKKPSKIEKIYFVGVKNYLSFPKKDKIQINKLNNEINNLFNSAQNQEKEIQILHRQIVNIGDRYYLDKLIQESLMNSNPKNLIDVNIYSNSWELLEEKIESFEIEKGKYSKKLANKLVHNSNYSKEEFIVDMTEWELENENILEKIADAINSIIKKFNLKLEIDETTKSYEELIIRDLSNNNIIDYDDISTGTKNLLSTFIPLKSYNPKDSIILIDEPENSFYPDIQRELTDLYMNVGENNQLIMATHSPLIASSFEPWEVVELKFDGNNQIYRELYYEGENHIDNYTLDPRMLTWTSILTDIFDLKEDSNFTVREKKLMEYATLKAEIKAMNNIEEKEEAFKELKKISKLLGLYN